MISISGKAAAVALAISLIGCGTKPQNLLPTQFVRARVPTGNPAQNYGELHPPLLPDDYSGTGKPTPAQPVTISPLVRAEVPAPGVGAGAEVTPIKAATEPTVPDTQPTVPGGYQVVGTVLARVKNYPIYAHKVLAALDRELAAEARKFDRANFQAAARQDIDQKIQEMMQSQLEIERADTSLSSESKTRAQMEAQMFRKQQITLAGGSEAVARQRALEAGETLDEQVHDRYNMVLVQLYYDQHVTPKIHVTSADMRQYYNEHLETEFKKPAEVKVRIIRIDINRAGGPEQASAKVKDVLRELKGADFADVAKKYNDDPDLQAKGGDIGWWQKGGYRYEKVEDAFWSLTPGQYTQTPIAVDDPLNPAIFIVYAEARRGGTVQPFDSPAVQNAISFKLHSQQFSVLRQKEIGELLERAVVFREPGALDIAVDMAMQRYPLWASAASPAR